MRRTAFIVFLLPLALLVLPSPALAAQSCRAISATGMGSGAPAEPSDPPGLSFAPGPSWPTPAFTETVNGSICVDLGAHGSS
jgi:hypothetical protein